MNKNNFWKLLASIAMCQAAGVVGSFFTVSAIENWYRFLNKPAFSPPNWLFAPVWLTLYALMGIALYLIWKKEGTKFAFWFFIIHLFVNAGWSIIFFGFQNITLALGVIILLLAMIAKSINLFRPVSRTASYLLVPYLVWVSFATVLNYYLMVWN